MPTFQEQSRALLAINNLSQEIADLKQESVHHRMAGRRPVAESIEGEVYRSQARLDAMIEKARQLGFYEVVTNQNYHNPKFDRLASSVLH